jgi:6-phosphogluconolactonase
MRTRSPLLLVLASFLACFSVFLTASDLQAEATTDVVYVGTYTDRGSKGIYAYEFDVVSGDLKLIGLAAETPNPSFMAMDAAGRHLYAVNEISKFSGNADGSVTAFAINPVSHKLEELNAVPSGGTGPAYVSLDRTGRNLLVANYGGGSVATFRVTEDGRVGSKITMVQHKKDSPDRTGQRVPRPHSIVVSDDNRFAIVPDLGLNRVVVYRFDPSTGSLRPGNPPFMDSEPQSGPRHFKFHPSGKFGYVTNEFSSSITVYSYDSGRGTLTPIQTISMKPKDFEGDNTAAEVVVHPSGKYVYASNRGHDSIVVFSVDPKTGKLALVEHVPTGGNKPRHFNVDATGKWLVVANQQSDNINVFRIDVESGRLKHTRKSVSLSSPVFVMFAPATLKFRRDGPPVQ